MDKKIKVHHRGHLAQKLCDGNSLVTPPGEEPRHHARKVHQKTIMVVGVIWLHRTKVSTENFRRIEFSRLKLLIKVFRLHQENLEVILTTNCTIVLYLFRSNRNAKAQSLCGEKSCLHSLNLYFTSFSYHFIISLHCI